MYKVDFYTLPSGKSPVREFILNSEVRVRRKILRQVKHIETFGLTLENCYLRKLIGMPFWESRILGKDSIRIICVGQPEKKVVILNIFKKKSNRTPFKEIKVSMQRYENLTNYI